MTKQSCKYFALILCTGFFACHSFAKINFGEDFMDIFSEKKSERKKIHLGGLQFSIDEEKVSCQTVSSSKISCRFLVPGKSQGSGEMVFETGSLPSIKSAPLLKLNRKNRWQREFAKLNHYLEKEIDTGIGKVTLQEAKYFRLNNILLPVLIHAFDVVISERVYVSIAFSCDLGDWPTLESELGNIEKSLLRISRA